MVTMVDEIYDRHYQAGRKALNASLTAALGRLAHAVDNAFEVPLEFLMKPDNHQMHSREWNGTTRTYYAMPFGERYIWGVTAGILRNLYERIYRD